MKRRIELMKLNITKLAQALDMEGMDEEKVAKILFGCQRPPLLKQIEGVRREIGQTQRERMLKAAAFFIEKE
jgi:hypothetical protein